MSSKHSWLASQVTIGFTAGIIASFITQPADVVKTYRQVAPTDYRTIRITVQAIQKVRKSTSIMYELIIVFIV